MIDLDEIQGSAPSGVAFTSDVDQLPRYPLQPIVRTPLHRNADGRLHFIILAQLTLSDADVILSVPDVLAINGETQIGLSRANRIMQAGHTSLPNNADPGRCNLCVASPGNRLAFDVDNPRPFGPLLHKVVCSTAHRVTIAEVTREEIRDATELFYEIGHRKSGSSYDLIDGLTIGMNVGEYARSGASQTHFHYQVTGLSRGNYNAGDRLGAICIAYRDAHPGGDYLGDYLCALRHVDLVLLESDHATAYTPISPRFKGEIQIMLNRKEAGNILNTTTQERDALADLQWEAMQRFARLGCHALNQVWYMTRFSADNNYGQRLVLSLCPRTSIFAFYELSGNHVIDVLPWKAAQTLRAAAELHFAL
jgi:galactose-1-phosphate uridylyltransferase